MSTGDTWGVRRLPQGRMADDHDCACPSPGGGSAHRCAARVGTADDWCCCACHEPRIFPVTNPDIDAPDGAIVDGSGALFRGASHEPPTDTGVTK